MQTTKFTFELPNDRTDLIEIANFLVQKAKNIKDSFKSQETNHSKDRLKRLDRIIGLIDDDISDEEVNNKRAKKYDK